MSTFFRNAGVLTINRMFAAFAGLAVSAISARLISPYELGALVSVTACVALIMRAMSLGLGQAAQYYGSREIAQKQCFSRVLFWAVFPILVLSLIILYFGGGVIGKLLLADDPITQQLFSQLKYGVPLTAIHMLAALYFLGKRDMQKYFLLSVVPLLASVLVLIPAFYFKLGLNAVINAWIAQYVVSFVLGVAYLVRKGSYSAAPISASVKYAYAYGGKSFFVFLASFAVTRISLLIGGWFTSADEVGHFALARVFSDSLLLVLGAAGPLVFSYVGAMDDPKVFRPFIGRASRLSFFLFFALSIPLAAVAPIGMPLIFGKQYAQTYSIVWIFLPGIVFSAVQRVLENYLYGRGKQVLLTFAHGTTITVLFVASAILAPMWGGEGLAVATTVSCAVSLMFTVWISSRVDGLTPRELLLPLRSDFRYLVDRLYVLITQIKKILGGT